MNSELNKLLSELPEIYQEIYGAERLGIDIKPVRGCRERLENILAQMDFNGTYVLDVGSNMGFFSLALADRGAFVVSLEPDERFRKVHNYLCEKLGLSRRNITLALPLNYDSINFIKRNFAHFDAILMLSLWHHFIGTDRWEQLVTLPIAGGIFKKIWRGKYQQKYVSRANELCKQAFSIGENIFFDTGQSDEERCRHIHLLPDMSLSRLNEIGKWIINNIFADPMYYDKKIIGSHIPHTSKNPRYLVHAKVNYARSVKFRYAYESSPIEREFEIDIDKNEVAGIIANPKLPFIDETLTPYNSRTGKSKFKFGGNLNDLMFTQASLDYRYLAHRVVDKIFDLHEKYGITHNDIRTWNIIFSLPEYDVFLIDFERAAPINDDLENDILALRLLLQRMALCKPMPGIEFPENLKEFVYFAIGGYAQNCYSRNEFHDFINSQEFFETQKK